MMRAAGRDKKGATMENGMALSRAFYYECAEPLFKRECPDLLDRAAVGLVGEGSECLGFDDAISRDHDWGPGFCLWLPHAEVKEWEAAVERVFRLLPETYQGVSARMTPERRMGRVGLFGIEDFYRRFIGMPRPPKTIGEWRAVPEHFFAVCTNGEVFADTLGQFTEFRNALLAFYPEDLRLKKIAARCMNMAQTGQYNLLRSLRRGETVAAMLAAARFTEQALSMTYLLNRRYMPFYKWAWRGVGKLPVLGALTQHQLALLAGLNFAEGPGLEARASEVVETLCATVARVLREEGLSDAKGAWLLEHGPSVQARIKTPELRAMPVMAE